MSRDWVDKLCDQVDQSDDFNVLSRIMPHIGINVEDIQNLMKQKIQQLHTTAAKRAAFNVLPIQSILPMDTVQHIMSFQHYSDLRTVCKTFKKCYDRNQDIAERSRQRIANDYAHLFSPDINYDESINRTFVVCSAGDPLSEDLQSFGTVIPWQGSLEHLLEDECDSGDRILVQDGEYEIADIVCTRKDLQIIGIGKDVNIILNSSLRIKECSKIVLRSVNVTAAILGILISDKSKMWMENCVLKTEKSDSFGIIGEQGSLLSVNSSCFFGHEIALAFRGDLEKCANIINCKFVGCDICIQTEIPLHCIGNVFQENRKAALIVLDEEKRSKFHDKSVFAGNVFIATGANSEFDWLD